ncbi:hypothetical protein [Thalassoroseus pseudoceratinae]|uniref:hypothetical protein n=1 Tax=Thalassoroseus pseudoceratinae TaxID=2713176 RepID=UPI001421C7B5|nr:hypothetical protein [Thalassoroseus pseudoceratinae]
MTIRIVVLALLTGLFAAAWSSDTDSQPAVVGTTVAPIQSTPEPKSSESMESEPTNDFAVNGPILRVPEVVTKVTDIDPVPMTPIVHMVSQSDWVAPEASESKEQPPTPPGIASGHYRVVTNDGVTTHLTVPGNNRQSVRDIYIYRTAERRWYYIRQEKTQATPQPKVSGPSVAIVDEKARQVELADQEAKRQLQVFTRWLIGYHPSAAINETAEKTEDSVPTTRTAAAPADAERQ